MEVTDNLTCPACDNTLTQIKVSNIVVDICQNGCGGIWFDKNELKNFDEKHELADMLLNIKKNDNVQVDYKRDRKCPRCDIKLFRHFSSIKMKIEIDECSKCEGFWLDDKELESIRNEFENEAEKTKASEEFFHSYASKLNQDRDTAEKSWQENASWYEKLFKFIEIYLI